MSGNGWHEEWCKLEKENQQVTEQMWYYKARAEAAEEFIEVLMYSEVDERVKEKCREFLQARQ